MHTPDPTIVSIAERLVEEIDDLEPDEYGHMDKPAAIRLVSKALERMLQEAP